MKTTNNFTLKSIIKILLLLIGFSSYAQDVVHKKEYHPDAISISESGLISGLEAINAYWTDFQSSEGEIVEYNTVYKIPVMEVLEYEIGLSRTGSDREFAHVIVWSKEKGSPKMVEVVLGRENNLEIPAEISHARNKWVQLCNKHNAKNLVTELYTKNAIYYNRGRILEGHEQLTREYSYMNDPSYALQLNPKHIEMVTTDTAFELGQCSGSYPLPYILIWKKQNDGHWKVYFDSNF